MLRRRIRYFEVDSTESVWYKCLVGAPHGSIILKLTPQSQYGIKILKSIVYIV